jgi:two-component system, cell cycle response regulator CtrA
MKVLLIEDDNSTAKAVQAFLCAENIVCDLSENGSEAFEIGTVYNYDVIILDIGLPDVSGHDLLEKFRASSVRTPILVLSGLQSVQEKVRALGFGADDYMTKPFDSQELVVRLRALSRRAEGHPSSIIKVGEIELNLDMQTIEVHGQRLDLTGKEYQILEFLMIRKGATVTKGNFLNRLYSGMDEPEEKIIDVFMCKIRRKLEKALGPDGRQYIETIWGRGYVLREPSVSQYHSGSLARAYPDNVRPLSSVESNG